VKILLLEVDLTIGSAEQIYFTVKQTGSFFLGCSILSDKRVTITIIMEMIFNGMQVLVFIFLKNQERDIAMRIRLAADSKLKDRLYSESINNTDQSRVFLGPEFRYESKDGWSFIVASNFAIKTESASDGVVPQYSILSVFSVDI
jgi:hypothetical protein